MKKSIYCTSANTAQGVIHYNSFNNQYLLLSHRLHKIFINNNLDDIEKSEKRLYDKLLEKGFIIEDSIDEEKNADFRRLSFKMERNLYHVVINTTLVCNLDCWYCYEEKPKNSKLRKEVTELIKKHIGISYNDFRYKFLKISFFGGEPLLNFNAIKDILLYANKFCLEKNIELFVDFTTNGSLLNEEMIFFLKDYKVEFQITIDGFKEKHDKTRYIKKSKKGTYDIIISKIKKILENIQNSYVWIRINFDQETLNNIENIINDISDCDKKRSSIIFRKIWQINISEIKKEDILKSITIMMDKGFFVDYYALPRSKPCFAERLNQVLINYDGGIFKCSTLEKFCNEVSVGNFLEDGSIKFDNSKIANKVIYNVQKECKKCKIYPACYGPCSENSYKNGDFYCILSNLGINMEELIIYNFMLYTNLSKD